MARAGESSSGPLGGQRRAMVSGHAPLAQHARWAVRQIRRPWTADPSRGAGPGHRRTRHGVAERRLDASHVVTGAVPERFALVTAGAAAVASTRPCQRVIGDPYARWCVGIAAQIPPGRWRGSRQSVSSPGQQAGQALAAASRIADERGPAQTDGASTGSSTSPVVPCFEEPRRSRGVVGSRADAVHGVGGEDDELARPRGAAASSTASPGHGPT